MWLHVNEPKVNERGSLADRLRLGYEVLHLEYALDSKYMAY